MNARRTTGMRGDFNNSTEWLEHMPPSTLSTTHHATLLQEALLFRTGVPWIVTLVPLDRRGGGGFFLSPPPDRLKDGHMLRRDWGHLKRLFGAIPASTHYWYMFPDEIAPAFAVLKLPIFPED